MITRRLALALIVLAGAAGCRLDDQLGAAPSTSGSDLLQRYVSMGNSITAGFQSAGINDSTQRQSYAVLVARAAGISFFIPSLALPGCPPPLINNLTMQVVGPPVPNGCALRAVDPLAPYISNVAVPGAQVIDPLNNLDPSSSPNPLTTFILGGQTQAQAMARVRPTFVSLWIGNNDVLGALTNSANPGDPALITSQSAFQTSYSAILNQIDGTGAKAALISVANVSVIPFASRGSVYWCLKTGLCPGVPAAGFPPVFTVDNTCAPAAAVPTSDGDNILVPWTKGIPMLLAAAQGLPTTLDCSDDAVVVLPAELDALQQAVTGYNAYIQSQAASHGYAYLDVNPALGALVADGTIPPFPNIPADAPNSPVTFGPMFTLDGVHPSATAHRLVADSLIASVNRTFGTTIRFVP